MRFGWFLLLAAFGAAPTTRPTTQPTYAELDRAVVAAGHAVEDARAQCLADLERSPDYLDAAHRAEVLRTALESARATGTAQEKLDASRAFVAADQALKKMRAKAIADDFRMRDATASLVSAQNRLGTFQAEQDRAEAERKAASEKAAAERDAKDPIKQAMKRHDIAVGMTVEQADASLKARGHRAGADDEGETWEWPLMGHLKFRPGGTADVSISGFTPSLPKPPERIGTAYARVVGGKIVSYRIVKDPDAE